MTRRPRARAPTRTPTIHPLIPAAHTPIPPSPLPDTHTHTLAVRRTIPAVETVTEFLHLLLCLFWIVLSILPLLLLLSLVFIPILLLSPWHCCPTLSTGCSETPVCLSIYLSVCLPACISGHLSIHLSVYLSACLCTCLSICPSTRLSIHLPS